MQTGWTESAPAPGTPEVDAKRLGSAVGRFYDDADTPARMALLSALLRPVGPLGLAGIAAGAFATLLPRPRWHGAVVTPETISGIGAEAVVELVQYVEQKAPDLLARLPELVGDGGAWMASLSGVMLLIALRAWSRDRRRAARAPAAAR